MHDLTAEIEGALLDAMQGDPWGPLLAGRLERVARAVLLRHGLSPRIGVAKVGETVQVHVALPAARGRVQTLVVRVSASP